MKKLAIATVLVVLLIGVGYLKMLREDRRSTQAAQDGYKAGLAEAASQQQNVDSLRQVLAGQQVTMAESLFSRDRLHASRIDSLTVTVDSLESRIAQLKEPGKMEEGSAAVLSTGENVSEAKNRHLEILGHYRKAIEQLPGDLTAYERRVALFETRQETAQKFSITVAQLNEIRTEHSLDF